ncbi:terminase TerL endonuclease subunit [Nocardia sp. NPDC005746]|uniref:terminase TerL endonuclease subunit n=1 Tax=Nocardia sp. NPDC005746 TaxID=3157062 RepID=UPI0033CB09B7
MQQIWLPNPPSGTAVCAGFDGSENNDWTALRCETRDGLQFTPRYGPDRRPTIWAPEEWGGRIPRGEVHAAVDEVFTMWAVERMYCDPQDWRSEIGDWALRYGDEHVIEWATNRNSPMYEAIRRYEIDLQTGRIRQDGCPIAATHIGNARKVAKPGNKYVLGKPADHQKIDAAITSILAHEAAADAREGGWEATDGRMFCFS